MSVGQSELTEPEEAVSASEQATTTTADADTATSQAAVPALETSPSIADLLTTVASLVRGHDLRASVNTVNSLLTLIMLCVDLV